MSCRLLLRRVASRGVLPRERFSPLAPNGPRALADECLLVGAERTSFRMRRSPNMIRLGHRLLNRTRCGRSKPSSTLRSHEAMGMLRTQEVMMQVSYPLSAGNRHI